MKFNFTQLIALIFGVLFIWLILGTYFKNNVGVWMAAIWYLGTISTAGFFTYIWWKNRKPKNEAKVINAKVIKR